MGTAFGSADSAATKLAVSNQDILAAFEKMYNEQKARLETETKPNIEEMISNGSMPRLFDFSTILRSDTTTAI
jgi:hypothetical protein